MADAAVEPVVSIGAGALGRGMPMHLCLDPSGLITSAGPTLAKIAPMPLVGLGFFTRFDLKRPIGIADIAGLRGSGQRLHLTLRGAADTGLRGLALALPDGGVLLNLSFGIDLPDAVRQHRLSDADFAPTDLAVELLYLIEVKTLVMAELHDLNRRLQGAKSVAEEQAQTDTLTGLRNRRAMDNRLAELIDAGAPFGLMHLDLDWFKQVNDTFGHAAGDHVLQHVARVLTGETRLHDIVARVGGDEFVIILPGLIDAARMHGIAHRIIDRLNEPIPFGDKTCSISASVGMAISSAYARPRPDRMLSDADQALYASKHAGRGRATVYSPDG